MLTGDRYGNGYFSGLGYRTYFWSSREFDAAGTYDLYYDVSTIYLYNFSKNYGFSARCLED